MAAIAMSTDHGYVMISAGLIAMEAIGMGGSVMGVRKRLFATEEFKKAMQDKGLMEEHKKAFPEQPNGPILGYPDMGSGRYSDLLPYAQWVEFNNAQRAHHNFLEQVPSVLTLLMLAGIRSPRPAAALGLGYFVARILYAQGYRGAKGAKGREAGAISGMLCLLGLFGLTVHGGLKIASIL
mmetsp:Transcript_68423/g.182061  ORF Transcript_68423/g.182061 Transcript_68423/m.182061 type:complete len:181 (-) Transcript_68423:32-574(-)